MVLDCFHPYALTVERIRVLELLAVYGEDVGARVSLQPRIARRFCAFGTREQLVREGLAFLVDAAQAEISEPGDLPAYSAMDENGDSHDICGVLHSSYVYELYRACMTMREQAETEGLDRWFARMTEMVHATVSDEIAEPQSDPVGSGRLEKRFLEDIRRMEGLADAAREFAAYAEKLAPGVGIADRAGWLRTVAKAAVAEMKKVEAELCGLLSVRIELEDARR